MYDRRMGRGIVTTVLGGATAIGAVVVHLMSCTLVVPTDGLAGGAAVDAAEPGAALDGAGGDGAPGDGSSTADGADGADGAACASGQKTFPMLAFDATPSGTTGSACGVANLLADDGLVAGLDRPSSGSGSVAGKEVTQCVGADFGEGASLSTIVLRMGPGGNACNGFPCQMGPAGCGTGNVVSVFAGPTMSSLRSVPDVELTSAALADYDAPVKQARFVVVCRQSWGQARDDVLVDSIATRCP